MRSLTDREPARYGRAGMIEPGDDAPEFTFTVDGSLRRLSEFRGSPVVVVFHGTHWDPARDEYVGSREIVESTPSLLTKVMNGMSFLGLPVEPSTVSTWA